MHGTIRLAGYHPAAVAGEADADRQIVKEPPMGRPIGTVMSHIARARLRVLLSIEAKG